MDTENDMAKQIRTLDSDMQVDLPVFLWWTKPASKYYTNI